MKIYFTCKATTLLLILSCCALPALSQDVSNWEELNSTVSSGLSAELTQNITAQGRLNNTLTTTTIDGHNNYIEGNDTYQILYNNPNASAILNNITIQNGNASETGGAIFNSSTGTLTISESHFGTSTSGTGNSAQNGGAIYNTGILNSTNNTFENNAATNSNGGAIYNTGTLNISGDTFNNNTANAVRVNIDAACGGAIYNYNAGDVNIDNSAFTGNSAYDLGGAIYNENTSLTISNSTFTGNNVSEVHDTSTWSGDKGGAIYATGSGDISISNSTFENNYSSVIANVTNTLVYDYGVICNLNRSGTTTISNSTFTGNYATAIANNTDSAAVVQGGTIYNESGDLTISNSIFTGNYSIATDEPSDGQAEIQGGVIYTLGNTLTISDSIFNNNYATATTSSVGHHALTEGGVIYNDNSTVNILNSTFSNNRASAVGANAIANGGVIFSSGTMTITNGILTNNSTTTNGGAVYNTGTLTINGNSEFTNNSVTGALADGGAIYNLGGDINISSAKFTSNQSIDDAGAIYIKGGSVTIANGTIFENNSSNFGGAIFAGSGATLNITGGEFNSNQARGQWAGAGAIYIGAPTGDLRANLTVDGTAFTNNSAIDDVSTAPESAGGALGLFADATINNATFTGNNTNGIDGGGAIFLGAKSNTTIQNSTFTQNSSETRGGAISTRSAADAQNTGAYLDIINSKFIGNTATTNGGAIDNYFYNSTNFPDFVNISGSEFKQNTAANGGAIYNHGELDLAGNGAQMVIGNSIFENNTASLKGGAIYTTGLLGIDARTGNTVFSGNRDSSGANDIYLAENGYLAMLSSTSNSISFGGGIASADSSASIVSDANLNIGGNNANYTGTFTQYPNRTTNVTGSFFGGTSTFGDNATVNFLQGSSYNPANVTFSNANLNISNAMNISGNVNIGTGATPVGSSIGQGTVTNLTIANGTSYNSGTLTVANGILTVNDGANITGGTVKLDNANAKLIFNSDTSTITYGANTTQTGTNGEVIKNGANKVILTGDNSAYKGKLTIAGGSFETQGAGKFFGCCTNLCPQCGCRVNIKTSELFGQQNITGEGSVIYQAQTGNLTFDSTLTCNTATVGTTASNGVEFRENVQLSNNATMIVDSPHTSFDKDLLLNNATLNFLNGSFNVGGNLTVGSTINMMNGNINTNVVNGNFNVGSSGIANLLIDINPSTGLSDMIIVGGNITSQTPIGFINISDFNLLSTPVDNNIELPVITALGTISPNVIFTSTGKTVSTPIGNYQLLPQSAGRYNLTITEFNPQIFRGQVATVASYANQLVVNNLMFNHIDLISNQLLSDSESHKNIVASTDPNCSPYQYDKTKGGVWFKPYGLFENIAMRQGLDVNNIAYGALIGMDFPLISLPQGWKLMPTAYVAYNGATQNYNGVGMFQNGGQAGLMGTVYKGKLISSFLGYGGAYGNEMNFSGTTDRTGNGFFGGANKTAYNINVTKDFIVQPTFLTSYNMFGAQNYSTELGGMSMRSGFLNGINVAPGLNLIWNKETFSLYATAQYMFNIWGSVNGTAGNVDLPDVAMRHSYIEYGIGGTKTFTDRFAAYGQFTIRNIGRLGISVQGGLKWFF